MKSVNGLTAAILEAIASVSIAEQRITESDLPAPVQKTANAGWILGWVHSSQVWVVVRS
jgi:hypothetical protein